MTIQQRSSRAAVLGRETVVERPAPVRSDARSLPAWLRTCVILAIVLGVFFRFFHVDRKVYWDDEVFTSLHVLGLTEADAVARSSKFTSARELRALIHPAAGRPNTVADTVRSLAVEDPHHTPLYYIVAYGWVKLFGDSIFAIRLLSAILGVVALPCMYWLCRELFMTTRAAWTGTALLAVAPVSVLYSQEAREYALWAIAVLVMSAAFIRATRVKSAGNWTLYGAAVTFALYVFPFSAFLALGNLTLLASRAVFATVRQRIAPLIASAAALVLFAPWIGVFVRNLPQIDKSMNTTIGRKYGTGEIVRMFLSLFRLDFIDLNLLHAVMLNFLLLVPVLVMVSFVIVHVARSKDQRIRIFILAMIFFASAPFVLPDLLISGDRTFNARYFTPLFIALDLGLVYLFESVPAKFGERRPGIPVWSALFALLLIVRVVSCAASSQAETWWNKYNERSIDIARVLNAAPHPLVIGDNFIEFALSLSNYLDDRVALDLRPACYQCATTSDPDVKLAALTASGGNSDVFLLGPSTQLRKRVQAQLRAAGREDAYHCIDVRSNCTSSLHLW